MIERAVLEHGLAQSLELLALLHEVAATILKLALDLVIDGIESGHRLLGGADHAVVKRLGVDDGVHRELDIGGVVDDNRSVASANAQGGLARGVGGLHHAGANR